MLRIRLRRVGKKKRPAYRMVVADSRAPRDGAFIENAGPLRPADRPGDRHGSTKRRRRSGFSRAPSLRRRSPSCWSRQGLLPSAKSRRAGEPLNPNQARRIGPPDADERTHRVHRQSDRRQPRRSAWYAKKRTGDTVVYYLEVAEPDMGKVIGKQGRIANAMRALLKVAAAAKASVAPGWRSASRRSFRVLPDQPPLSP